MGNKYLQIGAGLFLVILLVSLLDPFMLTMPTHLAMMAMVGATIIVALFAGTVLQEKAGDERESHNRSLAGRIGYLAGLVVLTLGVLVEGLTTHHVDTWVASALGVMVIAKILARFYADSHN